MIIVKCIKNVEKELEVIDIELERESNKKQANQEQIDKLVKQKEDLQSYIDKYKLNLSQLDDLSARIYYKIAYEGLNPMKAIDKVAEENYLNDKKPTSNNYIFRTIYPKIKELL